MDPSLWIWSMTGFITSADAPLIPNHFTKKELPFLSSKLVGCSKFSALIGGN